MSPTVYTHGIFHVPHGIHPRYIASISPRYISTCSPMITPTEYKFPPKYIIFSHGIYDPVLKELSPRPPLYPGGNILPPWGQPIYRGKIGNIYRGEQFFYIPWVIYRGEQFLYIPWGIYRGEQFFYIPWGIYRGEQILYIPWGTCRVVQSIYSVPPTVYSKSHTV